MGGLGSGRRGVYVVSRLFKESVQGWQGKIEVLRHPAKTLIRTPQGPQ